jgi:hypothetical protein
MHISPNHIKHPVFAFRVSGWLISGVDLKRATGYSLCDRLHEKAFTPVAQSVYYAAIRSGAHL